jgi:hypothetical protein
MGMTSPPSRRNHVVAEAGFTVARSPGTHRDHLMACHVEHVSEAQENAEGQKVQRRRWPRPEPDCRDENEDGANPARLGIVAAINPAADVNRGESRNNGKAGGDNAEPYDRQAKLDGSIGGRDPHHQDQHLGKDHMRQKRNEEPIINAALEGSGRARLLDHRPIAPWQTQLSRCGGFDVPTTLAASHL